MCVCAHQAQSGSIFSARQLLFVLGKPRFMGAGWGVNEEKPANLADSVHHRLAGQRAVVSHSAAEWHRQWTGPAGRPRRSCTPSKRWNYDNGRFQMDGLALFHCTPPATWGKHTVLDTSSNRHITKHDPSCLDTILEMIWSQCMMNVIQFLCTNLFTRCCLLIIMFARILALIK